MEAHETAGLEGLALQVAQLLSAQQLRLAVAESCTGGWVAMVLTGIAGSSQWFDRGFVTYSNQSKQQMLGVQAATLETCGAVSEQTVAEMTQGALKASDADVTLAISGIAGPGGGTPAKPVGTPGSQRGERQSLQRRSSPATGKRCADRRSSTH